MEDVSNIARKSGTPSAAQRTGMERNGDKELDAPTERSWASIAAPLTKSSTTISMRCEMKTLQNDALSVAPTPGSEHVAEETSSPGQAVGSRLEFIRKHDWRTPTTAPARLTTAYESKDWRSDRSYRPPIGSRTPSGCLHANLRPGTLIWHWDVRPRHNLLDLPAGWTAFIDDNGQHMTKKGRYYIIVENLTSAPGKFEVSEVAIYSNDDTGLEHVKPERHHEYFSLCPQHIGISKFKNLNPPNPVLKVDWMRAKPNASDEHPMMKRTTMLVRWSDLQRKDINVHGLRIVGALSDASREILVNKALAQGH